MAELTGSEILAKALKKEGTDNLLFIMGGPMLLAEACCIKEGIRPIDVRHEQAAALMGQAYSRLLQRPAVCMAAAVPAIEQSLERLKATGTDWHDGPVLSPMDIFRRVGFDWWQQIEEKFAPRQ